MKVGPVLGRNQMIARPHRALVFQDVEDVIPSLAPPTLYILVGYIGVEIGATTVPAPLTGYCGFSLHGFPLVGHMVSMLSPPALDTRPPCRRVRMTGMIPRTVQSPPSPYFYYRGYPLICKRYLLPVIAARRFLRKG